MAVKHTDGLWEEAVIEAGGLGGDVTWQDGWHP